MWSLVRTPGPVRVLRTKWSQLVWGNTHPIHVIIQSDQFISLTISESRASRARRHDVITFHMEWFKLHFLEQANLIALTANIIILWLILKSCLFTYVLITLSGKNYPWFTRRFWAIPGEVLEEYPRSTREVSEKYRRSTREVSEKYRRSTREVSEKYQRSIEDVSETYQRSTGEVPEINIPYCCTMMIS